MTSNRRVARAATVRWMISVAVVAARAALLSKWCVIHMICINIPINAAVQLDCQRMHLNVCRMSRKGSRLVFAAVEQEGFLGSLRVYHSGI